jgi:acetamidase/formamidase
MRHLILALSLMPNLPAETYNLEPQTHSNVFSAYKDPVLHVRSGDTVVTSTWDAVGQDRDGKARVSKPYAYPELRNALNGPFYIEDADYGDTLEIHFDKIRLNRNWGYTTYRYGPAFLEPRSIEGLYKNSYRRGAVRPERDNLVRWSLDLEHGLGTAELAGSSGFKLVVPVKPMLGCVGVAPPGEEVQNSGTSGTWGGNMDYNDMVEGATLLLPVYHKGAFLYIGDGHAVQGDGEGLGMGIETSMDVQFTVRVEKNRTITMPRLVNKEFLISVASQPEYNSNLDLGLQRANSDMIAWLTTEFGLTPQQAHLLLGTMARHQVVTYFGTVTTMIPKSVLPAHK